uniref:Uncharacterized protein n=1 Tax=Sphaerodactylus townsendi TaxID=933632 RepID=A0ACB8ER49_9SAUR
MFSTNRATDRHNLDLVLLTLAGTTAFLQVLRSSKHDQNSLVFGILWWSSIKSSLMEFCNATPLEIGRPIRERKGLKSSPSD